MDQVRYVISKDRYDYYHIHEWNIVDEIYHEMAEFDSATSAFRVFNALIGGSND